MLLKSTTAILTVRFWYSTVHMEQLSLECAASHWLCWGTNDLSSARADAADTSKGVLQPARAVVYIKFVTGHQVYWEIHVTVSSLNSLEIRYPMVSRIVTAVQTGGAVQGWNSRLEPTLLIGWG